MENQSNHKYPKYLVSLSNTLIKLYSSVKGPEVFQDLLPKENKNSKNFEVDPYLLLSKVNVLTSHLSQVKVPEFGLAQSLACSDSTDYERDENRTVKIESNCQDIDSSKSYLTMKNKIDMIETKGTQFIEEIGDSNKNQVLPEQVQIQIKISNAKPKSEKKKVVKQNIQPTQRNYWDQTEDQTLLNLVDTHGEKWTKIANILGGRTGKQVRDRYINYLRPTIKRKEWTAEEEAKLHELYNKFGNKWSTIAVYLNGRTENQVKNRFYASVRRQKRPIIDHLSQLTDEEPALIKFVKTETELENKNQITIKTELFTKSEDSAMTMKQEFSDSSNSIINNIKLEPKEEFDRAISIPGDAFSNALLNAIKDNQNRHFAQSSHYQKDFLFLKSEATSTTSSSNDTNEENI